MTIGKKILFVCATLLLISIAATGFILNAMYYRTLVASTETYTSMLVEQIAVNLETRTREYEDSIYNTVQQWGLFENGFNNEANLDYHNRSLLSSFVNTRNTTKSPVLDMYILNESDELYYFDYGSQSFRDGNSKVEWRMRQMQRELPSGARAIWFTVPENAQVVYLVRCIYNVSTLQYEGVVAVGIDRSQFQDQFQMLETSQNGHLLIFGQEDTLIFGNSEGLPQEKELLALGEKYVPQRDMTEIENKRYIFQCKYSENEKWKVMYLISDEELLGQASKIESMIVTICIIAVLVALFCTTLISRGITREIRYLISHIQKVREGQWEKIAPPFPKDEIGDITVSYNQMVEDLQHAVHQLAEQMVRTEKAQYRALQAEFMELQAMVNPHFIYNAMEAINARAKLAGQEEISLLCTRLGRLMRAVIRPKMELIPLEMELQYVEAYLDIQKTMMDGRLEVYYDFDEGLEGYKIPALLLQPLVENAIIHGVEHIANEAVIVVAVSREERFGRSCLVIRISDNGRGIDQKTLEELFRMPENDGEVHYGVQSVIKRIQICFGQPYGVFVDSHLGEGTTFSVVLPAEHRQEELMNRNGVQRAVLEEKN